MLNHEFSIAVFAKKNAGSVISKLNVFIALSRKDPRIVDIASIASFVLYVMLPSQFAVPWAPGPIGCPILFFRNIWMMSRPLPHTTKSKTTSEDQITTPMNYKNNEEHESLFFRI
jgi:hypothetical protein